MADSIRSELFQRGDNVSFEVEDSKLHNACSHDIAVQEIAFEIKPSKKETSFVSNKESDIPR